MQIKSKKVLSALLALAMVFGLSAAIPMTISAANTDVAIAAGDSVAAIQTKIQNAINAAGSGDTITVTGSKTGTTERLTLDIPSSKRVIWKAEYTGMLDLSSGPLITRSGNGTFEIAAGAYIRNNGNGYATGCNNSGANIVVSGGTISAAGYCLHSVISDINISGGSVEGIISTYGTSITISGGTVTYTGGSIFHMYNSGSQIAISGGTVSAGGISGVIGCSSGSSGVVINITGGTLEATAPGGKAIYTTQDNAKINISGGTVSAVDGYAINSTGKSAEITVSGSGTVTAPGDVIFISGADTTVNVSGGTISATGTGTSSAIYIDGSSENTAVNVNGGTISSAAAGLSHAICSDGANSIINVGGGTLKTVGQYGTIHMRGTGPFVNISDGFVFGYGTDITGENNVIYMKSGTLAINGKAVVCAFNPPAIAPIYNEGSTTDLIADPAGAATTWGKIGPQTGINYKNGTNTGFFPISGVMVNAAIEEKYTVTFYSNGGSAIEQQFVNSGSKAVTPANPTKSGENFAGWYKDELLTSEYDFNAPVTANIKLYAKWTAVTVAVMAAPSNLTAIAGAGGVSLNWKNNADIVNRFEIQRKESGGIWSGLASSTTTAFFDVTALAGKTYSYRVQAFSNDLGVSSWSNEATVTMNSAALPFPFTDVKTSHWFYNDVKTAWEMGLINGKTNTLFAPEDNLTYAEAVKLAACMHQLYTAGAITLTNGSPNWYDSYVTYAKNMNIINKDYDWNAQATRAGYMEIFANALPNAALGEINIVPNGSIPDVPVTHPQTAAIYKLYRAGIVQGVDTAHNCNPGSNIKRSEVTAILTRMMNPGARINFSI